VNGGGSNVGQYELVAKVVALGRWLYCIGQPAESSRGVIVWPRFGFGAPLLSSGLVCSPLASERASPSEQTSAIQKARVSVLLN